MSLKKTILKLYNQNYIIKYMMDKVLDLKDYFNILSQIKKIEKDICFLVLTPRHGNLGDHAIAFAEQQMLYEASIKYIELTGRELEVLHKRNKLGIMNGYPVIINGGGNLGSLWPDVEKMIRNIIIQNPLSPIIIMPSTVFYGNKEIDILDLKESQRVYNRHKNLTIFARENISYEFMKSLYHSVKISPDLVLSLNYEGNIKTKRSGCLLCLRKDSEKKLNTEQEKKLRDILKDTFGKNVFTTDTVVDYSISKENRKKELEKKWNEFLSVKLVITDRLHGMIFAAITGTPCIVLDSKSPKIRGCYKWIDNLAYIYFLNSIINLEDVLGKMNIDNKYKYNSSMLAQEYQILKEKLQEIKERIN